METKIEKLLASEPYPYLEPGFCPTWLHEAVKQNVSAALEEDLVSRDISTLPANRKSTAKAIIKSNEMAIIAGRFWVDEVFNQMQADISVKWHISDGRLVEAKQKVCTIKGRLDAILNAERCALNFLQTLSGTATTTACYVAQLGEDNKAIIMDTRKTIPGLRLAQKYAVACGGGTNHRYNLYDGVLLKDNHIALYGSIGEAVEVARKHYPKKNIEIEVRTQSEIQQALEANADIIMLDNFALHDIAEAVQTIAGKAKIEVSGNVGIEDIKTIASYGVDYISIGALTKHLQAIDMSLKVQTVRH